MESGDTPRFTVDPTLDDKLDAFGSCQCRCVLYYFMEYSDSTASIEEICDFVCEVDPTASDRSNVLTELHHATLPKLCDVGFLDYDPRTQTIRYKGFNKWESFIHALKKLES